MTDTERAAELALERRFPGLRDGFPRVPLAALPTAVEPLAGLARATGHPALWIKRDDRSGRIYGGNKIRKLEFLLGDVRRRGRRVVLTFGALGTHHGMATAICGREVGLRTILVLVPQPVTSDVRRTLLLLQAFGAELHLAPTVARVAILTVRLTLPGVARGEPPYVISTGGSSALGTLGFVNAGLELAEQVRAGEMPEPDAIFVPLGSGGTLAGLAAGVKLAGLKSRVVGVLVTDIIPPSEARVLRLARAALGRLRKVDRSLPAVRMVRGDLGIVRDQLGPGYGTATPEAERAQRLMADTEGIALETTYSAKCLAALLALAHEAPYQRQTLLFWHTFSAIDPGAGMSLPNFRELPRPFHRFFAPHAEAGR